MEPTTLQEIREPAAEPAVPLPPADPIGHGGAPPTRGDGFSGKPADLAKDLALLAKQQGIVTVPVAPETPAPAQPAQPQAAATPEPPVAPAPEKFLNPDGTVNPEKVEKSLVNVEKALETYRQKEVELRRLQNDVHRMTVAPSVPKPLSPQPEVPQDLEALINADLAANPNNAGRVLAKWAGAIQESAVQRALGGVESLKEQVEAQELRREMEAMGKVDSWLLTEEGPRELFRIRQENPHLNQARHPWREAYKTYLGEQQMKQRLGSAVPMPTPKGTTAPVAPAVPTNRASSPPQVTLAGLSKDQLDAHLAGKSVADQDAFFRAAGLPGLPRRGK